MDLAAAASDVTLKPVTAEVAALATSLPVMTAAPERSTPGAAAPPDSPAAVSAPPAAADTSAPDISLVVPVTVSESAFPRSAPSSSGGAAAAASAEPVTPPVLTPLPLLLQTADGVDPWIGRTIDARYRVLSKLGQGGMGSVYRVEHQHMGKIAAMKVLHRELAADKDVVKRFKREAEAVSRLTHVNTVQTFDFGSFDGALYLVMEYVRGEDLGAIVKRDGHLPFLRIAPIFVQICNALSEAHEAGIIHRDLKPENVLVTRSKDGHDVVKVVDFGLAKVREREDANEVTGRGNLIGTPYYMSPEQIRSDAVDARTDIYSLGAMLYRMLTGEPPFTAATPIGVLTKHLTDDLVPPSQRKPELDIDPAVEAIVMRAMQKKAEDRYPTVDAMRAAIEEVALELGGLPEGQASGAMPARRSSDKVVSSPSNPAVRAGTGSSPRIGKSPNPWAAFEPTAPKDLAEDHDSVNPKKRLRREDLDDFERGLKRRGWMRLILVPVLVVGIGVAALLTIRWWQNRPRSVETEPNNTPNQANRLVRGATMAGHIEGRIDDQLGDIDFFKVPKAAVDGSRTMSVHLGGIPNIDLVIDVLDADGTPVSRADSNAVGGDEVIPNLRIGARGVFLAVHEAQMPGHFPIENTSDAYHLTVDWHPTAEGEESEPNDEVSPMTIKAGQPITGYLGAPGDIDAFRLAPGGEGKVRCDVTGIEGVDIALRVDGEGYNRRADSNGTGGGEHLEFEWKQGQRAPLIVLSRKDPPGREAHGQHLVGFDTPYHLSISE